MSSLPQESHLRSDTIWDPTLFDSAKTSLIFEIIEREKSIGDVVAQSLLTYFKHVSLDYNKTLVQKIIKVCVMVKCIFDCSKLMSAKGMKNYLE